MSHQDKAEIGEAWELIDGIQRILNLFPSSANCDLCRRFPYHVLIVRCFDGNSSETNAKKGEKNSKPDCNAFTMIKVGTQSEKVQRTIDGTSWMRETQESCTCIVGPGKSEHVDQVPEPSPE